MTEEIKIDGNSIQIGNKVCYCVDKDLIDYITNIQQENEILRKNAEHNDKVVDKARWNEMIYKSRCEKAIELINKNSNYPTYYLTGNIVKELKNILQGSDENE